MIPHTTDLATQIYKYKNSNSTYRHNLTLIQENDRPHGRPLYTPLIARNISKIPV